MTQSTREVVLRGPDGNSVTVTAGPEVRNLTQVRRGDRVVVKTRNDEVMAKELKRRTSKTIELRSLNPDHKERTLSVDDVQWIARIMWASQ